MAIYDTQKEARNEIGKLIREYDPINNKAIRHELAQALLVNSPIWETLFPQQKHSTSKLMLKQAEYSATDGKLGLTLNHGGIKLLYLLLHPELQKDLK